MNNSEQINEERVNVAQCDEMTQEPSDELMEVETAKLEHAAGGPDGTVLGIS